MFDKTMKGQTKNVSLTFITGFDISNTNKLLMTYQPKMKLNLDFCFDIFGFTSAGKMHNFVISGSAVILSVSL